MSGESNPFNNSEANESAKDWEVDDSDLEKDSKESEDKPKRRSLFETNKEKAEREEEKPDAKKPSLFESLLKGEEKSEEKSEEKPQEENTFLNPSEATNSSVVEQVDPAVEAEFEDIVDDKLETLDQEFAGGSEPVKIGALLANAALLENIADKLDEGQAPEQAMDNAASEVLENPLPDVSEAEIPQTLENAPDETVSAEDENVVIPVPPIVPLPPVQAPLTQLDQPRSQFTQNFNSNVPSVNPNTSSEDAPELVPMNDSFNRDPRTGKVIAAGLVGYMLGRRGGRKRTEEKLEPVINKQKEDIKNLNQKLVDTEELVRKRAQSEEVLQKESSTAIDAQEVSVTREKKTTDVVNTAEKQATFLNPERELDQSLAPESFEEKPKAEAVPQFTAHEEIQILAEQRRKEAIATEKAIENMPVFAKRTETDEEKNREKSKATAAVEQKSKEKARVEEARKNPDALNMTLARVLEIAEYIPLKNSMNLRQMYEAKRIDAVNLRRIVNEYTRGGNYEKLLNQSLEAVEIRSELKHEIKQDNSIYEPPEQTAHNVVDGLIAATAGIHHQATDSSSQRGPLQSNQSTDQPSQIEDTSMIISNGTAIVIGILGGIFIVLLILLYSEVL